MVVVLDDEVAMLDKIDQHMKVVVVVANNVHNVSINSKDNKLRVKQAGLNKVATILGKTKVEMIINQVVVFVAVAEAEVEETTKEAEDISKEADDISKVVVDILKAVVAVAEDVAISVIEALKKVHSNNKLVIGNKMST